MNHHSSSHATAFRPVTLTGVAAVVLVVATILLSSGFVGVAGQAVAQTPSNASDDKCRPGATPDYEKVRSLEEIFDVVAKSGGGEIIRAELAQRSFVDNCVWVYDVKLLSANGNVSKIAYDAEDLRMIGFSRPATVGLSSPVVSTGSSSAISVAPITSLKTLSDPDADGVADSGRGSEAASGNDIGNDTAGAAADAADTAASDSTDNGQRDGKGSADSKGDSGATGADSDQSSDSGDAAGDSAAGASGDAAGSSSAAN